MQAAEGGHWVFLKNLHLMTFWIPTLEKELSSLSPKDSFRLWLTAESHPKFSATLSESCRKVTYEAPPGVKRNLQRTLAAWGSEGLVAGGRPSRALFALAWFHAIMQERRTFIPQVRRENSGAGLALPFYSRPFQGWCKFYEFSDSDLKAGQELLERLHKRTGQGGEVTKFSVQGTGS